MESTVQGVLESFRRLGEGFARAPNPPLEERVRDLDRLDAALRHHRSALVDAVRDDFGNRCRQETLAADLYLVQAQLSYLRKHLPGWVKPEARSVPLPLLPARALVRHRPKGVVGVLAPWNYPINLALVPLATALAAGNRVLLKPSELVPRTSSLLAELLAGIFPPDQVAVVLGGAEVGAAVADLPLDHLLFTGSTAVGRTVYQAAARNLVPVTLELGGKSPVFVHPRARIAHAAERVAFGKTYNAGQTCIAPDYALVPAERAEAFVQAFREAVGRFFPKLEDNPDYTSIVSPRHKARLEAMLREAEDRGARVLRAHPLGESLESDPRLPPTLVLDAPEDCALLQEEIFGPILPIVTWRDEAEALAFMRRRSRPLAAYAFDPDVRHARALFEPVLSGGLVHNDVMLHFAAEDLPFGGTGPSGLGWYHGREGFEAFSHKTAVFEASRLSGGFLLNPPYGAAIERLLGLLLGAGR
jgi:coniferyl-aldehyde dehydrogenase